MILKLRLGKSVMPQFLYVDFDGVLHPSSGGDLFCKVHMRKEALIGKDCLIITSSSWRFHHPFKHLLGCYQNPCVDRSPAPQEAFLWADGPCIAKS